MLNSQETPHLIETSYDRLKSEEITFLANGENLAKAGVFRWVTNIHEHKRYYYTFDNSLLFTESSEEHYTNLSTLNHNVRFLPCQHRGVGNTIRVRAKPMAHRFNYSRTLPPEKFPVRAVDIVNRGMQ